MKTKKPVVPKTTQEVLFDSFYSLCRELTKIRFEFMKRIEDTSNPISDEELATFQVKINVLELSANYTLKNVRELENFLHPTITVREDKKKVILDLLLGARDSDISDFDTIEGIEKHF